MELAARVKRRLSAMRRTPIMRSARHVGSLPPAREASEWRPPARRPPTWLWIVAILLIVAVTVAGVAVFYDRAQSRVRQQLLVTRFEGNVSREEILAWHALTERRLSDQTIGEFSSARRQTDNVLVSMINSDATPAIFEIRDLLQTYRAAVDDAMQQLRGGNVVQAYSIDQTRMNPRFGLLREAMVEAFVAFGQQASAASRRAVEVSVALLIGALSAIGILAWRFDLTHQIAARLAGEHAALRRSEERFRALVQNASDVIAIFEADGTARYASASFQRVLGYEPGALIGSASVDLVHPADIGRVREAFIQALRAPGVGQGVTFQARHRNGSWRRLEAVLVNLLAEPAVDGVVANARDVTERWRAEDALREAESRYRALVERVPAVTYITDVANDDHRTVYISPQVETILGWSPAEWLADPEHWMKTIHPDDRERVMAEDARTGATGEPFRAEYRLRRRDERYIWVHDEAVPIEGQSEAVRLWQGVMFDITERRDRENQLAHQAFHDPLTGLPNRMLFMDRLTQALDQAPRVGHVVAVLFLDLDTFKLVNDRFGHDAGDRLLTAVAHRLEATLRPGDVLARLGGDEFTIMIANLHDRDASVHAAQRIIEQLRPPFTLDDRQVTVASSIGIAVSDGHDSPDEVVGHADLALYAAKRRGSAQVAVFDPAMTLDAADQQRLKVDLDRALRRGELQLYFQPVVDLATGRLLEVESLVRWAHPERGLLPPADFLQAAEEAALIVPLGRWVLEAACQQTQRWRTDAPGAAPLPVSVNISPRQLAQPTFAADVTATLRATGLPPELLKLEIGENDAAGLVDEWIGSLRVLKNLGVGLTVDNFGTHNVGLGVLRRMPIDTVKLDHSLIGGLERDRDGAALVRAVVGYARSSGLTIVAEGIETADQVRDLRSIGCDRGQGFFIAKPLPASEIAVLLAQPEEWSRMLAAFASLPESGTSSSSTSDDPSRTPG